MINKLLISILFVFSFSSIKAQLEVNSISTSDNLMEQLIIEELLGCNIDVTNIMYTGNSESFGIFNYTQDDNVCELDFGLDRGLLMTTGMIEYAVGPNNDSDDGQEWNVEYDDSFLHQYLVDFEIITPSVALYDACVLEFDITSSTSNSLDFEVIFGSEEYTEWISPFYGDVFCFFVSEINEDLDPNFDMNPQNIMETGDVLNNSCDIVNKPISPWTIRPYSETFGLPGFNECLYLDNNNGELCDAIGYDGYTIPMLFNLSLYPNATYHIKMVIIDAVSDSWAGLDSGVFIKKSDVNSNPVLNFTWLEPEYNDLGAVVSFMNTSSFTDNVSYLWDLDGDGNVDSNEENPTYIYEESGTYSVTLELLDNCTGLTDSMSSEIVIELNVQLEQVKEPHVSVFPNPVTKNLSISLPNIYMSSLIELVDLSGRVIYQKNTYDLFHIIDVSLFSPGLYYLSINDKLNEYEHHQKVIIL